MDVMVDVTVRDEKQHDDDNCRVTNCITNRSKNDIFPFSNMDALLLEIELCVDFTSAVDKGLNVRTIIFFERKPFLVNANSENIIRTFVSTTLHITPFHVCIGFIVHRGEGRRRSSTCTLTLPCTFVLFQTSAVTEK